jgi:hypothetical protein
MVIYIFEKRNLSIGEQKDCQIWVFTKQSFHSYISSKLLTIVQRNAFNANASRLPIINLFGAVISTTM